MEEEGALTPLKVKCRDDNLSQARKNELETRQRILFETLVKSIEPYRYLGFSIVFTGERNLECYTAEGNKKLHPFSFPLPVFSVVYKIPGFKVGTQPEGVRKGDIASEEEVVRFRFTPYVNGNGAIDYRFEELITGKTYTASGYLSWQGKTMLEDGEYWHFNVSPSDGLQHRAFDHGCVEQWLTRMYVQNASTLK
ncbi:hypothetical protein HC316_004415 [Salmonella enterica]|nr:hypothetical protein [Salmonella enterica]